MPFNLATSGNTKRVSLGTGVLSLAPFSGVTTDLAELGYGRGAQLQVTRQRADLLQGTPRSKVVSYAIQEDVTLTYTSVEWNATTLQRLLGGAAISGATNDVTMLFGGSMSFQDLMARFVHQMPPGGTVTLDLWRCQGSGELNLNFGDDFHEFPLALQAQIQTTAWGGSTLAENSQLFRLLIQLAA